MKIIGFLLLLVGVLGLLTGMMMFGDIGIAAIIGSLVGILSGLGFLRMPKLIRKITREQGSS